MASCGCEEEVDTQEILIDEVIVRAVQNEEMEEEDVADEPAALQTSAGGVKALNTVICWAEDNLSTERRSWW